MKRASQAVKEAFFREIKAGQASVKTCAAHAGVHYVTALNWMKKAGLSRGRSGRRGPRKFIQPVPPPVAGKADTNALMRFAAMVESMERRGQVSGIFILEEFQLVVQAKLGAQELLEIRNNAG